MSYQSKSHALVRARIEADRLLKDLRSGEVERVRAAATRLRQLPYLSHMTPGQIVSTQKKVTLQQALHAVALEHGFHDWPEMRAECERKGGKQVVTVPREGPLAAEHLLALAAQGIRLLGYTDLVSQMDGDVLHVTEIGSGEAEPGDIVHFFASALRACGDPRILMATAESGARDSEAIITTAERREFVLRNTGIEEAALEIGAVFRISPEALAVRDLEPAECVHCGYEDFAAPRPIPDICEECGRNRWTGEDVEDVPPVAGVAAPPALRVIPDATTLRSRVEEDAARCPFCLSDEVVEGGDQTSVEYSVECHDCSAFWTLTWKGDTLLAVEVEAYPGTEEE